MAPTILNRLLQALNFLIILYKILCALQQQSTLTGSTVQNIIYFLGLPHVAKLLLLYIPHRYVSLEKMSSGMAYRHIPIALNGLVHADKRPELLFVPKFHTGIFFSKNGRGMFLTNA
jgi:hypothetical protein